MSDPSTQHRIKRKPPPSLDISDRYPSLDPSDPFAPLWTLRSRTSSGLSRKDVPESDILNRARSASYLYSNTAAEVSLNTPISSPSPNSKLGHYFPYSQTTLIDSPPAFPLILNPLGSQPDLLRVHRGHANVRSPRQTYDLNDGASSGTESDTASVPPPVVHNTAFSQPMCTPGSNYRFPKLLLPSFLGSRNAAAGNRSSMLEFKEARKSTGLPPVVSTVTWTTDSINSRSTSGFTTSADLLDCGSPPQTSDRNHHRHRYNKEYPMPSDSREILKQNSPSPRKLPSISFSPKMFRKRGVSLSKPFSSNTALRKRSISSSSYVNISKPTPSFSQIPSEDAYISPRKAPVAPPISPRTIQGQLPKDCSDKSCEPGYNCLHLTSSEWGFPSLLQLNYAACLPITGEDGERIAFGSLFESQPTIVIFIRHFWCPLCQDYMSSVNSFIRPEMVCNTCEGGDYHRSSHEEIRGSDLDAGTRVRLVVISNGAHSMIAKYRRIFGLPFKVYTDPSLAVYQALGMGRDRDIKHHNQQTHRRSTSVGSSSTVISEKTLDINSSGGYVKHSLMGGIAMVVVRAFKVGMSVWEKGGDIDQLGGEFVFGPGLTCTYAHRMQTTKGHAPIQDILKAAGISAASDPNHTSFSSTEVCRAKPELPVVPDWTTSLTGSGKKERKRHESMHTFRDEEIESQAANEASRRRYSIGMMSLEDEDRWMEYRQDSIERLRAKKDIRRGITRTDSSKSHASRPEHHQPLEMGSNTIGDHRRNAV